MGLPRKRKTNAQIHLQMDLRRKSQRNTDRAQREPRDPTPLAGASKDPD